MLKKELQSSNESLSQTSLFLKEDTKKQLDEKKSRLIEKNAELSELNSRLERIGEKIDELNSLNKDETSLDRIRQVEQANIKLLAEERKADMLKEINIRNSMLLVSGDDTKNASSRVDNLIRCLLIVSQQNFTKFSMFGDVVKQENHTGKHFSNKIKEIKTKLGFTQENHTGKHFSNKIKEIKTKLFLKDDELPTVTQNMVEEICNKLRENGKAMQKCVLIDNSKKQNLNRYGNNCVFLYEFKHNFLALHSQDSSGTTFDETHEIINNFLCDEILEEICKLKYKQKAGEDINTADLDKLYETLKEIKDTLMEETDGVDKRFLEHLDHGEKNANIIEEILVSQIKKLADLYREVPEFSQEQEAIKLGIFLLKEMYVKRMETMFYDECETRKKNTEISLKSNFHESNAIQQEFNQKQTEIVDLDLFIAKQEEELNRKSKEFEQKKKQLRLLDESKKKQDEELNRELKVVAEELLKREGELKLVNETSEAQKGKADQLRQEIGEINNKIKEVIVNKGSLEKKRVELQDTIESIAKEKETIEKEKGKYEKEKKAKSQEIDELKKEGHGLKKWIEFIENVYAKLLNSRELFKKRNQLAAKLDFAKSLFEKYKVLMQEKELAMFHNSDVESIAKENLAKRREIFDKAFHNILARPALLSYKDKNGLPVVELTAVNINYDEVESVIRQLIEKELKKSTYLCLEDSKLKVNDKNLYLKAILDSKRPIADELRDLIDRNIKAKFLLRNKTRLVNDRLSADTEIEYDSNGFVKLGDLNAQSLVEKLNSVNEKKSETQKEKKRI